MSLLIKGVDMPKNCKRCPCLCDVGAGIYICSAIKDVVEIEDTSKRQSYCAVSEIPTPHGRLIDADRLIVALKNSVYANAIFHTPALTVSQIEQLIEHQPTVIEKEMKQ